MTDHAAALRETEALRIAEQGLQSKFCARHIRYLLSAARGCGLPK